MVHINQEKKRNLALYDTARLCWIPGEPRGGVPVVKQKLGRPRGSTNVEKNIGKGGGGSVVGGA